MVDEFRSFTTFSRSEELSDPISKIAFFFFTLNFTQTGKPKIVKLGKPSQSLSKVSEIYFEIMQQFFCSCFCSLLQNTAISLRQIFGRMLKFGEDKITVFFYLKSRLSSCDLEGGDEEVKMLLDASIGISQKAVRMCLCQCWFHFLTN